MENKGYPPQPQQGGYPPQPQQGGYPPQPQQGGYPPQPQPQPQQGGYSQAPPPGYSPSPQVYATPVVVQPGPTVIVGQMPVVSGVVQFGEFPVATVCPNCRNSIQTQVSFEVGGLTWLACFGFFWLTACCCWIPFVFDAFKDVVHKCPSCGQIVGRYNRL